jgi:7 transmembrane receptor (rhodopsin family)
MFTDYSSSTISMFHMTMLAYDRYQAIVKPLKYSSPSKLLWVAVHIASIYTFSYTLWIVPVLILGTTGPYDLDCYFQRAPAMTVIIIVALTCPLFAMTSMYIRCIYGLRRHMSKLHPVVIRILPEEDPSTLAGQSTRFCGLFNWSKERPAARKQTQVTDAISSTVAI